MVRVLKSAFEIKQCRKFLCLHGFKSNFGLDLPKDGDLKGLNAKNKASHLTTTLWSFFGLVWPFRPFGQPFPGRNEQPFSEHQLLKTAKAKTDGLIYVLALLVRATTQLSMVASHLSIPGSGLFWPCKKSLAVAGECMYCVCDL